MKEVKISNIQLGMLTFGFLYGSTAVANPAVAAKRDGWIALILGWTIGAFLILMYIHISKLNYRKNLNEILDACLGKVLGKVIMMLYILFFIYKAAINTRAFGEFMAIVSYPETPLIFLMSAFIIAAIYLAKSGLETIGRVAEIFVPLLPIPIIIVTTSMVTMKDYTGFEPVLLEVLPVIKSAAGIISTIVGDFIVFLMILPYTNSKKGRVRSTLWAYLSLGVFIMIIVVRNIKVIGPVLLEHFNYPAHVAAQLIPGLNIDPLIDINLLLGGGFKTVVFLYAAAKATAEMFKIDDYKPLVFAFAVFVLVTSFWIVPNAVELKRWNGSVAIILITIPFQVILPLAIFFISMIKAK